MSIFRLASGQSPKLMATSGSTDFGGTTFTARLVQYFLERIRNTPEQLQDQVEQKNKRKQFTKMVWEECERAKLELECSHDTWYVDCLMLLLIYIFFHNYTKGFVLRSMKRRIKLI